VLLILHSSVIMDDTYVHTSQQLGHMLSAHVVLLGIAIFTAGPGCF